jgi:epoxyqueuosine reductase QueG
VVPAERDDGNILKEKLRREIEGFVRAAVDEDRFVTRWETPLVGFADARDPLFAGLKEAVSESHALPEDLLPGARSVISYFLPFAPAVSRDNLSGFLASPAWAQAYVDTNALIGKLGTHLQAVLKALGYEVFVPPATHNFDPQRLISDWSHRHVAFIAGLGRFGVNRMLITAKGCCGRIGSLVTALPLSPDARPEDEFCLYLRNGSCLACVTHCVVGALSLAGYDRHKCYGVCLQNDKAFRDKGKTDVCGKCLTDVPCSRINPSRKLKPKG